MKREIDPVILEQLTSAVESCGVPSGEFEISFEDYLQSEEIRVRSASLDDAQIETLQTIGRTAPYPIVTFLSQETAERASALSNKRHREESREWFRQRGLLDRLPEFQPDREEPMQFARQLEEFCGIEPGTVFEMDEELLVITPRMDWIGKLLRKGWLWRKLHGARHEKQVECLMRAISATNAAEHGVRFGFIGNAAFSEEDPHSH